MNRFIILILLLSIFSFSFSKDTLEISRVISNGDISESGIGSFSQYDKISGKTYNGSSQLTGKASSESIYLLQIKYSKDLTNYCAFGVSSGYFKSRPDSYFKRSEVEAVPLIISGNLNKKFLHSKLEFGLDFGYGIIFPLDKNQFEEINIDNGQIIDFGIYSKIKIKSFSIKLYSPSFTLINFPVKTRPNTLETADSIITTYDKYDLTVDIVSYKLGVGYEF